MVWGRWEVIYCFPGVDNGLKAGKCSSERRRPQLNNAARRGGAQSF